MLASVIGLISARRRAPVYAIELPDYIALEPADDLWLALARLRQPCASQRLLLGATIWAHPSHTDHLQPTLSVPVAYFRLRGCRTTLPEEASMEESQHSLAKEASLLNLLGLSIRPRSAAWRRARCAYACQRDRLRGELRHQ